MARWWKLFKQAPVLIPATYAFLASLWIFLSDRTLAVLVVDVDRLTQLQTYKGWFFVATTTVLLGILIYWRQRALNELNASLERRVHERTAALESANAELAKLIDDLKRTQHELVRVEKLAALGALVAGIAHELNTPIGNSLVVSSTLSEETLTLAGELAAGGLRKGNLERYLRQARQASALIMRNLGKASALLNNFKEVATSRASAQRQIFQLNDVVNEVFATLGPRFTALPVTVQRQVPPDLALDSYPGTLVQVLFQLIDNALVHGLDGGKVAAGRIEISASRPDGGELVLTVADNGAGIAQDFLPRIFDPFFTTRFGKGGSGLGLHVAHHLVREVLGGRLMVANRAGGGVAFSVYLPLQAPADGESKPAVAREKLPLTSPPGRFAEVRSATNKAGMVH